MPADMQLLLNTLQEMKDVYEVAIRNGKVQHQLERH